MDITAFVFKARERALQVGNYDTYRRQLTRQLLSLRRKLGRTTAHRAKYTAKAPISGDDIASNNDFAYILLIQAERAWAHAMHIRASHAENHAAKSISGATRRHIISRLHKAAIHANQLLSLLLDGTASKASDRTCLEAHAYALYLRGAEDLEKQSTKVFEDAGSQKQAWSACLACFSEAYIVYAALYSSSHKEVFRDALTGTLEPNMRVAAYRSYVDRTVPISTVAKQSFRHNQTELRSLIEKFNPNALNDDAPLAATLNINKEGMAAQDIPTTIAWRGRKAPIVDAAIGQALAATSVAASDLHTVFSALHSSEAKPSRGQKSPSSSSYPGNDPKRLAAAYDPVLNNAQDTVDTVRRALADLKREGIAESDPRMQDLRVSDLAANYSLINWRVGRNRVLMADSYLDDDGVPLNLKAVNLRHSKPRKSRPYSLNNDSNDKDTSDRKIGGSLGKESHASTSLHPQSQMSKPLRKSAVLSLLQERIVLYDTTLQSLESILSLRGASSSADFLDEIAQKKSYFQSLKCLTIGRSHDVVGSRKEALALLHRALRLLSEAYPHLASTLSSPSSTAKQIDKESDLAMTNSNETQPTPPTLDILPEQLERLFDTLKLSVYRYRGLVTLQEIFPFFHTNISAENMRGVNGVTTKANGPTTEQQEAPLISRLNEFPILMPEGSKSMLSNEQAAGVGPANILSLNNLVAYPPRLQPVPVKPIFLDIAWNYIDYPGRDNSNRDALVSVAADTAAAAAASAARVGGKIAQAVGVAGTEDEDAKETNENAATNTPGAEPANATAPGPAKKRGWFGFGRG